MVITAVVPTIACSPAFANLCREVINYLSRSQESDAVCTTRSRVSSAPFVHLEILFFSPCNIYSVAVKMPGYNLFRSQLVKMLLKLHIPSFGSSANMLSIGVDEHPYYLLVTLTKNSNSATCWGGCISIELTPFPIV
jgi:hypothetical protein